MPNVERLLRICSKSSATERMIRQMIGLKTRGHYARCLKELAKHGIRPVKSIRSGRVICFHLDPRQLRQLKQLKQHPHVRFVERDQKVKAHILPNSGNAAGSFRRPRLMNRASRRNLSPGSDSSGPAAGGDATASIRGAKLNPPLLNQNRMGRIARRVVSRSSDITWNVRRVQAPDAWTKTRGSSVSVAIIDTGIAPHPDLKVAGGINTMGGSSYRDDNGHGTHVAGIVAALGKSGGVTGVAPAIKLYAVKALNAAGVGYISNIVQGIDWCIKNNIKIINLSLGLSGDTSAALRDAVNRARKKGIIIVASAGNSGPNNDEGIDAPARYHGTIAVAASTRSNRIASFSSRGSGIDVTAPGSDIYSTWPNGGYMTMEGTSMASPHVSGGAALLLSREPGLSPSEVASRLKRAARKLSGHSSRSQGSGLIQLADAIDLEFTASARGRKGTKASPRARVSRQLVRSKTKRDSQRSKR